MFNPQKGACPASHNSSDEILLSDQNEIQTWKAHLKLLFSTGQRLPVQNYYLKQEISELSRSAVGQDFKYQRAPEWVIFLYEHWHLLLLDSLPQPSCTPPDIHSLSYVEV